MLTNVAASISPLEVGERAWPKILSSYRKPHRGRSLLELAVTLVPFVCLWALAAIAAHQGFWWGLVLIIPAAGFLLRLFMIQHDCGHGSFFAHRKADAGEKLLALGRGHRLLENVRHLAEASGARIVDDFEGTSLDAIRQMVSIGMGLSVFPDLYGRAEFRPQDDVRLIEFGDARRPAPPLDGSAPAVRHLERASTVLKWHFTTIAAEIYWTRSPARRDDPANRPKSPRITASRSQQFEKTRR